MLVKSLTVVSFGIMLSFAPVANGLALAQGFTSQDTGLEAAANTAGYDVSAVTGCKSQPGGCIPTIIGNVISGLLGIFGALFLVLIMWGGVQFMFAQGDTARVKAARQTLQNAILGLLIVAASYAIANFVLTTVSGATTGGGAETAPASFTPEGI